VGSSDYTPIALAALALGAIAFWLIVVASGTHTYLGSIAANTGGGLIDVITGSNTTRALFTSGSEVAPLWERGLSIVSVAITLIALVIGAQAIWKGRRVRPWLLALLGLGLLYPLLLPLRFVASAAETANRSAEFLYLGVGAILAIAALALRPRWRVGPGAIEAAIAIFSLLLIAGGVAVSWQYSSRLPQDPASAAVPYELSTRAIAADRWAANNLGPDHRFASDLLNRLGLATYGAQRPLYAPDDGISAWQVMAARRVDPSVREAIEAGGVEYVMSEQKLHDGVPQDGYYFDRGEPRAGLYQKPISKAIIDKFDRTGGAARLYDNGEQQIYDVSGLP
jgi:hypothetical protein